MREKDDFFFIINEIYNANYVILDRLPVLRTIPKPIQN